VDGSCFCSCCISYAFDTDHVDPGHVLFDFKFHASELLGYPHRRPAR
jgi:hypothetical protein